MTQTERLAKNPRLLFWGRALFDVKMLTAVVVLFYLHRGVTIDEVFYLSIVWSIASLLTEVPSGWLSDTFGRKRTLLLGAGLMVACQVIYLFAHGPLMFIPIFVLMSAAFSCFSGTDEALLFESLKASGQEGEMTKFNGRLASARTLFKILTPLIGAWVAKDLLEWQFQILIWVNIIAVSGSVLFLSRLHEPPQELSVSQMELGTLRKGIATIKSHPWLLHASLNRTLLFIGVFITWRAYQPLVVEQGVAVEWLGVFDFFVYLSLFVAKWHLDKIVAWMGMARFMFVSAATVVCALLVAILSPAAWVQFLALLAVISFGSARWPAFAHAMNHRIESGARATTLSVLNMIKGILDIPILLLAGWLAGQSLVYSLWLALALAIITILAFPMRQRDLTVQTV